MIARPMKAGEPKLSRLVTIAKCRPNGRLAVNSPMLHLIECLAGGPQHANILQGVRVVHVQELDGEYDDPVAIVADDTPPDTQYRGLSPERAAALLLA